MTARATLLTVALCAAAVVGGLALQRTLHPESAAPPKPEAIALTDLEGKPHTLDEYRGRWLLVNFWATWCGPCLEEIPLLIQAQKDYGGRGLQILGPAMDNPEPVRAYRDRQQLPYPVFVGVADVSAAMDALGDTRGGLPFSVLISPTGEIRHRQTGEFSRDELEDLLKQHLN